MASVITSRALYEKLIAAGILSPDRHYVRVIIDMKHDGAVVFYTEEFGDERLLDIDWADLRLDVKEVDK